MLLPAPTMPWGTPATGPQVRCGPPLAIPHLQASVQQCSWAARCCSRCGACRATRSASAARPSTRTRWGPGAAGVAPAPAGAHARGPCLPPPRCAGSCAIVQTQVQAVVVLAALERQRRGVKQQTMAARPTACPSLPVSGGQPRAAVVSRQSAQLPARLQLLLTRSPPRLQRAAFAWRLPGWRRIPALLSDDAACEARFILTLCCPPPLHLDLPPQLVVDTISKYLPGNRAGMSGASFALLKMQTGALKGGGSARERGRARLAGHLLALQACVNLLEGLRRLRGPHGMHHTCLCLAARLLPAPSLLPCPPPLPPPRLLQRGAVPQVPLVPAAGAAV